MVLVTAEPIDPAAVAAAVSAPECGAVVTFTGWVRDHHHGRVVDHLEYEAYEAMAVEVIEGIVRAARERWPLGAVAVAHRTGRLEVGEAAVVVAVAAAHRAEAFEACRYVIDRVKAEAPIWKREVWADGTAEWVGSETVASGEER